MEKLLKLIQEKIPSAILENKAIFIYKDNFKFIIRNLKGHIPPDKPPLSLVFQRRLNVDDIDAGWMYCGIEEFFNEDDLLSCLFKNVCV
jgi:hypothetical protein